MLKDLNRIHGTWRRINFIQNFNIVIKNTIFILSMNLICINGFISLHKLKIIFNKFKKFKKKIKKMKKYMQNQYNK